MANKDKRLSAQITDPAGLLAISAVVACRQWVQTGTYAASDTPFDSYVWLTNRGMAPAQFAGKHTFVATERPHHGSDIENPGQTFGYQPGNLDHARWASMTGSVLEYTKGTDGTGTLMFSPGVLMPGVDDNKFLDYRFSAPRY